MFFRVTRAGPHQYVQIARSFRDGGAVKQQTLLSLGRLDALQASGQLDALLRSGLRLSRRLVVLDAQAAGSARLSILPSLWATGSHKAEATAAVFRSKVALEVSRGFLLFAALRMIGPSTGKADGQAPEHS